MNRFVLIGAVLAAAVSAARASDLSLNIGPQSDPNIPDAQWSLSSAPAGPQFFDVAFDETGAPADEGLFAYVLGVRLVRPAGDAGGIRLSGAEQPGDHYIFAGLPRPEFGTYDSDADRTNVTATGDPLTFVEITPGAKVARIFYTIDPAGLVPGDYRITFDPAYTQFAPGEPGQPLSIPISLSDQGLVRVTPEPSGLAGLALVGLTALRRQRSSVARP